MGEDSERDTPVPISNTEVKSFSADGTMGESPWESRYSPVKGSTKVGSFFIDELSNQMQHLW